MPSVSQRKKNPVIVFLLEIAFGLWVFIILSAPWIVIPNRVGDVLVKKYAICSSIKDFFSIGNRYVKPKEANDK
ncbi:MAG: hypothetical protein AB1656_23745 [Candidatus Omnitrophota bacterium]